MIPRLTVIAFACATLIADTMSAAESCDTIFRSVSRFRGTIRSVRTLSEGATDLNPIDTDALFAVAIDIEGAGRENFAIHSPSRTFGTGKLVGRTFELEAERMDCNGQFWRYNELWVRHHTRFIEPFEGTLEVGHFYRTKVTWTSEGMAIPQQLDLPMHHDGEIVVTNLAELEDKHPSEIVFEVVSLRIKRTAEWSFLSSYELKVVPAK